MRRLFELSLIATMCSCATPTSDGITSELTATYSLFDPSAHPDAGALSAADGTALLVGVRFRSHSPGRLVAVRFYSDPAQPTEAYRVFVYSSDGDLIGLGGYVGETSPPAGWVTYYVYALGSTAGERVTIQPDIDYVVAYEAPGGRYTATHGYFDEPLRSGPLSTGVNAGVYVYTAAHQRRPPMPTESYRGSNYWVEPLVEIDGEDPMSVGSAGTSCMPSAGVFFGACPAREEEDDSAAVTLGTRFTPTADGDVWGVIFQRGPTNVFPAAGYPIAVWSTDGARLGGGVATISQNPTSGRITGFFDRGVRVTAGQEYVVSYHAPVGRYAVTEELLSEPRDNGSLRIPAGGGVYAYGASEAYPSASYLDSFYFVDPVFVPLRR